MKQIKVSPEVYELLQELSKMKRMKSDLFVEEEIRSLYGIVIYKQLHQKSVHELSKDSKFRNQVSLSSSCGTNCLSRD